MPEQIQESTILHVEDSGLFQRTVAAVLKKLPCRVVTAPNRDAAIQALSTRKIDLVLLDIYLGDGDGVEIGEWIRANPATEDLRIIFLTSNANADMVRRCAALQNIDYMLKPVRPSLLREKILPHLARPEAEIDVLERVQIPTFSHSTQAIIELANKPEASIHEYATVVGGDVGLSAVTLRLANSPEYGGNNEISDVHQACVRLGVDQLKSVCLSAVMSQELPVHLSDMVQEIWTHCLMTAVVARAISRLVCPDNSGDVYVAGLFHCIGVVSLLTSPKLPYDSALHLAAKEQINLSRAERRVLGFDHAELGYRIAKHLNMTERVCEMIRDCENVNTLETLRPDAWSLGMASIAVQRHRAGFKRRSAPGEDWYRLAAQYQRYLPQIEASLPHFIEHAEQLAGVVHTQGSEIQALMANEEAQLSSPDSLADAETAAEDVLADLEGIEPDGTDSSTPLEETGA
ncbi:MAG: response regulator [Planctomycetota bacterium]